MNKRELGKLLEELHEELRAQIDDLKSDITQTKRLKSQLESYFEKCQEIIDKVTDEETGIEVYRSQAETLKTQLEKTKAQADSYLQSISSSLASVQTNVQEMEEAYEAFTEVNEKVTDDETGMDAMLTQAEEIKEKIESANISAQRSLQSISSSLASVQTNVQEMEEAYEAFTEVNEKVTDDETGMDAMLTQATGLKGDIVAVKTNADTLYKEIRKFRDDAANYIKEIGGLKSSAASAVEGIQTQHQQSQDLRQKIEEIFNIGSRGIHSNYFAERRNMLFWISIFWLGLATAFIVATVVLAVHYILPVANLLRDPQVTVSFEVFLIRFSIVTPTIFAALYSLKQFAHDRRLYEKYAFKAISTYSAEASVATLTQALEAHSSEDKDSKIIDFAVDTFKNIYLEPVEPIHDKWIFRSGNKIMDLTAEVNQSVGEIKKDVEKLADNVPATE